MRAPDHLPAPQQLTLSTSAVAYELIRIRVVAPLQQRRSNCAQPLESLRRRLKTPAYAIFEGVSGYVRSSIFLAAAQHNWVHCRASTGLQVSRVVA
jgi:hypothetical protein